MSLSDKRKEVRKAILKWENKRDIHFLFSLLDLIERQDKKAVEELKRNLCLCKEPCYYYHGCDCENCAKINKIFGDFK